MLKRLFFFVQVVVLVFCSFFFLNVWYGRSLPSFSEIKLRFADSFDVQTFQMPLWYSRIPVATNADIDFTISLKSYRNRYLLMPHSGMVTSMTVNNIQVDPKTFLATPDFGGTLRTGDNVIHLRFFFPDPYNGIILTVIPSLKNIRTLAHIFLQIFLALTWSFLIYRKAFRHQAPEILSFLVVGIVLRSLYVSATPWCFRAYDAEGHLGYIFFVAKHWLLPVGTELWQGHQAPLYYVFAALIPSIGASLGWSKEVIYLNLQSLSFLLSIATLWIGSSIILSHFRDRLQRAIGVGLLAVFPSLVFLSAQITNDALFVFFGFLWYRSLQSSLKEPRTGHVVCTILWLTCGILTKANAILWLGPTCILYTFFLPVSIRQRLRFCAYLFLSTLVSGSFFLWRFLQDRAFGIVANAHLLSPLSRIDFSLKNLFIFNPVSVLLQPFVHRVTSEFRPEYFFESLFRTMQFGSSTFTIIGLYPLLFAMMLIPIGSIGFCLLVRRREWLPFFTIAFFLAGLIFFCFRYPYSSSQHFRYIEVMIIPLVICLVEGCSSVPFKIGRIFFESIVFLYVFMASIFFLSIFFSIW